MASPHATDPPLLRQLHNHGSFDPNAVLTVLEDQEVVFVPMTKRHAARALDVPLGHRDPFDELLLVQAQEEGLQLLTADRQLAGHPLAITVKGRL